MTSPTKPALAALFSRVMELRYPHQPYTEAMGEDYVRVAMDGDPVVLLEAAWDWFRLGTKNYRPSPGELREISEAWVSERHPYIPLEDALKADVSPGLQALINRFGKDKWAKAGQQVLPSHESAWAEANREHRVFIHAKTRMLDRGSAPFNPSEAKGLHLGGMREALCVPAAKVEHAASALAEGVAQQKRIS